MANYRLNNWAGVLLEEEYESRFNLKSGSVQYIQSLHYNVCSPEVHNPWSSFWQSRRLGKELMNATNVLIVYSWQKIQLQMVVLTMNKISMPPGFETVELLSNQVNAKLCLSTAHNKKQPLDWAWALRALCSLLVWFYLKIIFGSIIPIMLSGNNENRW